MNLEISKIQLSNPTQSSLNSDSSASKAIDGILTGFGASGGCASTNNVHDRQWWRGEFADDHVITTIKVIPRYDCCRDLYTRVTVKTSLDGIIWSLCADLGDRLKTVVKDSWVDAKCPESTVAKYVKIVLHDKQQFALCEVEVWGFKATMGVTGTW